MPRGFDRYISFPHTVAVTPESLRSSLGRGGMGTPRGFDRYISFPHTAAVTPESLRSSLGRGGIGTPRGVVRYISFPHTAAVTPESLRSNLGRGGIGTKPFFSGAHTLPQGGGACLFLEILGALSGNTLPPPGWG